MTSKWFAWVKGMSAGPGRVRLEELGVRELTEVSQMGEILEASEQGIVAVFKHSTRCPISAAAYREVASYLQEAGTAAPPFFLVKVIESRPLSNEIARQFGIMHQSPQLILVKCKRAYFSTSHGGIEVENIRQAINTANN